MPTDDGEYLSDDGLTCPDVGAWSETKHRIVSLYSTLFSSGMKAKWSNRVYVELYAGAGRSRVRGSSKTIPGSPLLALAVKDPFDKYIFCEENAENMEALKARSQQAAPHAAISYISGNCNLRAAEILAEIPRGALSLCFADPFDIGLKFETIRALASARSFDFLILLALGMDANRNYKHYVKEEADKIDNFVGSKSWRDRWATAQWDSVRFTRFLADEFSKSMATLRYIPPPHYTMKEVKIEERNVVLYRLALFSRSAVAYKFWDDVLKYSTDQRSLF
jgi:three-Cys-motif partner protein